MADLNMRNPNLDRDSPMASADGRLTAPALNFADWVALILLIIGGINWGSIALTNVDLVAAVAGSGTTLARIIYALVGLSALWAIFLAVRLGRRVA